MPPLLLRFLVLAVCVNILSPNSGFGQFLPQDFGQTMNGFQDDFLGVVRDSNWVAAPRSRDAYVQSNGVLKVTVQNGDPNHLLYAAAGYDSIQQEVLARMRVLAFAGGSNARAGIGVGVDSDTSQGLDLLFINFEPGNGYAGGLWGRQFKLLDDTRAWGPPGFPLLWQTNTWYWLRLKQTRTDGGKSGLQGKVWLADGSVPEPPDWPLSWEREARSGFAGILGGSGSTSDFEVDYVLIKAKGLPFIKAGPELLIMKQPVDRITRPGQTVAFSVSAIGRSTLNYQWQIAKAGDSSFKNIQGATDATVTTWTLTMSDHQARYRCLISAGELQISSYAASLSMDDTPPTLGSARTLGNPEQVTVFFSKPIDPAVDKSNFTIAPEVRVIGVQPGPSAQELTVHTTPLEMDKAYTLIVRGIRDLVGNEIPKNTRMAIDLSVEVPSDYGTIVNGFQDDFNGPKWNAAWQVVPPEAGMFTLTNGVLRAASSKAIMSHLLFRKPNYDAIEQEVLARMRINRFTADSAVRAGVGVALDIETGEGINLVFRDGDQAGVFGRQISLLDDRLAWGPPVLDFAWQEHAWYWVRLRQSASRTANGPNIQAKFWPADGLAREPADWQLNWELENRAGCAGVLGPSAAALSEFEVDYILIKAHGLPQIKVAPQAFRLVPHRP